MRTYRYSLDKKYTYTVICKINRKLVPQITESCMNFLDKKKNRYLLIACCIILYIMVQLALIVCQIKGMNQLNGVFVALQFAICLLMVSIDHKKGIRVSLFLMLISLLSVLRAFFMGAGVTALPGLCNSLLYILALVLLNAQILKYEKLSETDPLTATFNRRGLVKYLKHRIDSGKQFGLLHIKFDNFRVYVSSYGEKFADQLLIEISSRIKEQLADKDVLTRTDGSNFVIVVAPGHDTDKLASKIISSFSQHIMIDIDGVVTECFMTLFAGASSFPENGDDYQKIITCASAAVTTARENNTRVLVKYDDGMEEYVKRQSELDRLIRSSMENEYFYMNYQPQYKTDSKTLRGFEALLRLKTPEGERISPGEFIPVAEKHKLMDDLDCYVLRHAMKEFYPVIVETGTDATISINISAQSIEKPDFYETLMSIVNETAFPVKNLEIEITEYSFVEAMDVAVSNISKIREAGIKIALDDFGTGYTSLNYLERIPIDLLKIDKSLIDDIEDNRKHSDFIGGVIRIGHLMDCEVLAEGVEHENQCEILKKDGCDIIQGFVWGRPLEFDDAKGLLG